MVLWPGVAGVSQGSESSQDRRPWHPQPSAHIRAWLDSVGAPVDVQQKLTRHTDVRTSMRYGDAFTSDMAEAHGKVVGLALNGAQTERKVS